jgi:MFS family permease
LLFAISAGAISMFNVQIMSVRQAIIPEHLFGRVQGAFRTVIWGGIPVGMLVGGVLGGWLGLPAVFLISGVAGIVVGTVVWLVLHSHRHEIDSAFEEDSLPG